MFRPGRGTLFLLLAAGLVALGSGAWVAVSRGSAAPPLRSGALAPEFDLPALEGGTASLAAYRGRVVFVNFWATWCTPCREEAPALQILYERLRPEGFDVLAISIDDAGARDKIAAFVRQFGLAFPILLDPEQRVYREYQAYGVPETYLIDREGRVVERFIGPKNWDDARYERAIRHLLELGRPTLPVNASTTRPRKRRGSGGSADAARAARWRRAQAGAAGSARGGSRGPEVKGG